MTTEDAANAAANSEEKEQHPLAGLKIVVNVLDDCAVFIGLTQGAVDPFFESLAVSPNDELIDILKSVPEALEKAKEKWTGQPRNPAYTKQAAPRTPRTTGQTGRGRQGAARPDPNVQAPQMF